MAAVNEHLKCSKAEGIARAVGAAVAFYAHRDTGIAYPSDETLKENWGFAESTVRTSLRALEELGEIVRRPDLQTRKRKRVYVVTWGQAMLFEDAPELPSEALDGYLPSQTLDGSALRAHGNGTQKGTERNLTPPPPNGGASTLTAPSPITSTLNGHRAERAAPSKSRRRADRRAASRASAPGRCPLSMLDPERLAVLAEETAAIVAALKSRWGEDTKSGRAWRLRSRAAHLHDLEPLMLAFPQVDYSWAKDQFPAALQDVCGRPVRIVSCEGAGS